MTEILTESFCERCGTRYTFESSAPRRSRLGRVRTFSKGVRNFVMSDDASFSEAMADARSELEMSATAHQLDAFHQTFNFCLTCRQYTCGNCWNQTEGRCLTCAPVPGLEEPSMSTAATIEPSLDGNGHAPADMDGAWPEADLARIAQVLGEPAASTTFETFDTFDDSTDHDGARDVMPADAQEVGAPPPVGATDHLVDLPASLGPAEDLSPAGEAAFSDEVARSVSAPLPGVAPGQSIEDAIAAYESQLAADEAASPVAADESQLAADEAASPVEADESQLAADEAASPVAADESQLAADEAASPVEADESARGRRGGDARCRAGLDARCRAGLDARCRAGLDVRCRAGLDVRCRAGLDARGGAGLDSPGPCTIRIAGGRVAGRGRRHVRGSGANERAIRAPGGDRRTGNAAAARAAIPARAAGRPGGFRDSPRIRRSTAPATSPARDPAGRIAGGHAAIRSGRGVAGRGRGRRRAGRGCTSAADAARAASGARRTRDVATSGTARRRHRPANLARSPSVGAATRPRQHPGRAGRRTLADGCAR